MDIPYDGNTWKDIKDLDDCQCVVLDTYHLTDWVSFSLNKSFTNRLIGICMTDKLNW